MRSSTRCVPTGRSQSAAPVRRSGSIRRPIGTRPVGPARPLLKADQGDLRNPRPVRLPAGARPAAPRGLGGECEADLPSLQGDGHALRNKTPRRRVKAMLREDRTDAVRPNDFVHDQLATGRKLRVLTVVDTFSRYCLALDARFTYRGEDVVATLERVCAAISTPKVIRVDQGTEFVSRGIDLWAYPRGVTLDFSRPRKTHGQRVHRSVQRAPQGRVPERPLVPEPCRRDRKVGGLA